MLSQTNTEGEGDAQAARTDRDLGAGDRLTSSRQSGKAGAGDTEGEDLSEPDQRVQGPGTLTKGPLALANLMSIETGDPALDAMARGVALAHLRDLRT